jgi:thiol-disulfide isomerase/thioredoxin
MESINNTVQQFQHLPKIKKLILLVIVIIVILFVIDLYRSYIQNYNNVKNYSKKISNNIEKLNTSVDTDNSNNSNDSTNIVIGDLELDPKKTNISLYFANWCGHCKQFKTSTWDKIKELYTNSDSIKINDVDCTNVKSQVKTAAGKTIQGFPTVIINYKNSDGEYIEEEYSGGRSYEVFNAYVEKFNSK